MTHSLTETQSAFLQALFDAGVRQVEPLVKAAGLAPQRRLDIYRNNVFSNLRGALQAVHPVILRLVGDAFFNHAANQFIARTPSESGDIHEFGAEFAAFLAEYPHAAHLPYLPDVARLEWLHHRSFHAADHPPLDARKLADVPGERYAELRCALHPAVALLQSRFPLLRIWQVNQDDYQGELSVDWDAPGSNLLVSRQDLAVQLREVSDAEFVFLRNLADQATLGTAVEAAIALDEAFDLQSTLARQIAEAVVVDFSLS